PYWPSPSERGYRNVHRDEYTARKAAGKSRDACALLVARCTMAIALVTTDTSANPPQWFQLLTNEGVLPAWIDLLRDSIITDLSPGLRAGAFINFTPGETRTAWINHVPCMIRANLPVYVWWPKPQHVDPSLILAEFPFFQPYLP
ncbi:hypothetical protein LXA43DRAFT_856405, partial [Ganoderma leucocontextum]